MSFNHYFAKAWTKHFLRQYLNFMKSATIRLIVILALICTAGIIITQVYWVRKALLLEEREFDLNVHTALRDVATDVMKMKETQVPLYSPVTQITPDYFIVQANVFVEKDVLQHFLVTAFTRQNLLTDFEYALYDCTSDTVQYQGYYHMPGSTEGRKTSLNFPRLKRENYYFGVYFPNRRNYLTSQISVWIISSVVLLGVLGFLAYLLVAVFKQKRLREIQKDFVNNMTHEFKTPLSTIQLSAEVLKNPSIANNPQRLINYATIISNEAVQLTLQVERVLQMAHADKTEVILKKERFIWQELIGQVVESFRQIVDAREGTIVQHLPDEPVTGYGDVLHLKNTLSNLLDNAIKYCEDIPEVHIFLNKGRKDILLSVQDNGIGIEKQHQKLLFEKFYRVPTGNVHNVKGFGLGLNYVRLITKSHGGEVKCESEKGKGTIFTLSFPINNKNSKQ